MLSILITIYNYNLFPLVTELQRQCIECGIDFEILTQDDASNSIHNAENEKINSLPNCSFISLEKNVGLRENKNLLAKKAKYDNLLIIDGDCKILNPNYIRDFLNALQDNDVVYGGRLHAKVCPSDNQKLRWRYGRFMEDKSAINRKKTPYPSLLFNNTLIKKDCFNAIKFDSGFTKYGHDDTLFSYELRSLKAKICHIENPVEHDDIDSNIVYYNKTKHSLENLKVLYTEKKIDANYVKLITLYHFLTRTKLDFFVSKFHTLFEKPIRVNLQGNNPSLFLFNVFKIGYFCSLKNR